MAKNGKCPDTPCEKFRVHSVLEIKNFQKIFELIFGVKKKKLGAQTPNHKNLESTALCKLKNSKKNFQPQI